jgi:hypothetical protein
MIQSTSILVNLFFDLLFLQVKKVTSNSAPPVDSLAAPDNDPAHFHPGQTVLRQNVASQNVFVTKRNITKRKSFKT